MPLERPHFLEETLTKISSSIIAERTFLSFAAVALWAMVVSYDDHFFGQQELPPWTSCTASSLNQPIFDQPAGQGYIFAAILLWGHLRTLVDGHCRPTVGADGHPVMLGVEADGHPVMLGVEADLYDVFVLVSPSGHSC